MSTFGYRQCVRLRRRDAFLFLSSFNFCPSAYKMHKIVFVLSPYWLWTSISIYATIKAWISSAWPLGVNQFETKGMEHEKNHSHTFAFGKPVRVYELCSCGWPIPHHAVFINIIFYHLFHHHQTANHNNDNDNYDYNNDHNNRHF